MRRAAAVLALALTAIAGASAAADGVAEMTPQEQAQVQRAEDRGRTIYAYDQAAWYSTDEMLRVMRKADLPHKGAWIVEPRGELLRVIYFGVEGDAPFAYFHADMAGSKVVDSHIYSPAEDRSLTPLETRMAMAEQAAMTEGQTKGRCTNGAFNPVVLPPAAPDDPVAVYLLSSMVVTGEYPAGGHYEFDIGPDGKVVSQRAFTKACLNMNPAAGAKAGNKPVAAVVSHLLDPTPTEIHVYLSLWMGQPLFVLTQPDGQVWGVQAGHVAKMSLKVGKPAGPGAN